MPAIKLLFTVRLKVPKFFQLNKLINSKKIQKPIFYLKSKTIEDMPRTRFYFCSEETNTL